MIFNPEITEKKLTLRIAIEESIELWQWLADNPECSKLEYFGRYYDYYWSNCFLCQYVKDLKTENNVEGRLLRSCRLFNCPLKSKTLCGFSAKGSAFNNWFNAEELSAGTHEALKIVRALKKILHQINH